MNQQFMPTQAPQYGGMPGVPSSAASQGLPPSSAPPMPYTTSRRSPAADGASAGFQSVSLSSASEQSSMGQMPPANLGKYMPPMRAPANQLPPGQMPNPQVVSSAGLSTGPAMQRGNSGVQNGSARSTPPLRQETVGSAGSHRPIHSSAPPPNSTDSATAYTNSQHTSMPPLSAADAAMSMRSQQVTNGSQHMPTSGPPSMSSSTPLQLSQPSTGEAPMSRAPAQMPGAPPPISSSLTHMSSGPQQMSTGPQQMSSGPPQMSGGLQQMSGGPPQISSGPPQTSSGSQQMSTGPQQMSSGPPQMSSGPPQMSSGPPQMSSGQQQMSSGPLQMSSGLQQMSGGPPQTSSGQQQISSGQQQMSSAPPQISSGLQQLQSGPQQTPSGLQQMSSGPPQSTTGLRQMSSGPPQTSSGLTQMTSGPPSMSGGLPSMSGAPLPTIGGPPAMAGYNQGASVLPPNAQNVGAANMMPPAVGGPGRAPQQMPPHPMQQPAYGQPSGTFQQTGAGGYPPQPIQNFDPNKIGRQETVGSAGPPRPMQNSASLPNTTGPATSYANSHASSMPPMPAAGPGMSMRPLQLTNGPQQMSMTGQPPLSSGAPSQPSSYPPTGEPLLSKAPPQMSGAPPPMFGGPPPLAGGAPPMSVSGGGMRHARPPMQQQQQMPGYNQGGAVLAANMQNMHLGATNMMPPTVGGSGRGPPHMPPPPMQQPGYGQPPGAYQQPGVGGFPQQAMQQQQPGVGGYPQQAMQQQQQQQKRLDPDQMPSQIQVTEDDQAAHSGPFYLNQKGLVPPLVTTNFIAHDQGYASPRFVRSTMYNVPISNDLMKQTAVPFGLLISPMARLAPGEYAPPIVDFGTLGPVRCIRCKAYMSPYMQFIDAGRRFQCLFCRASTEVPAEYFQHLDHTGYRMDRMERPELVLGTYELLATPDYCRNNKMPKPPAFIFVIDVSYNNVKSGLVHLLCSQMKQILRNLPVDQGQDRSNMRVGFITYNSSVHFYNIKGTLAAPQMLVVGDTHDMFMPLLDGFLCTPEESEQVIDLLMEKIPAMFVGTRECETILLPAIQAGLEALKAAECVGKLLVFHSTLPNAEAPGKLKNRDERKLLGTDKEKTVLTPQNTAYNQLGQDCVGAGCSVDLYAFNNAYIDLATIGQVSRLTGGEIFKYTYFQADLDGSRLINDIILNVSRPIAFDSIMRVRTSTGVRPTEFYGHFFMSNTTDIELAAVDCDKAVAVEVKHDDKLAEEDDLYIQIALLYTSCSGIRRLRVINQALKTCSQMADLYRSCDLDTIVNFFAKQAVWKLLDNNPKTVKDNIVNRAAQMLANYRKNCANPSSAGQLILPECMKLLPLYVNCLLKSDAISGGADMTLDDRSFAMYSVLMMDVVTSVNYFYPRLIPVTDLRVEKDDQVVMPSSMRCTIDKLNDQGVYLLENGIHMFLWIGLGASQSFVEQVFGVPSAVQINIETAELPRLDNPLSQALHRLLNDIRRKRHRYMRLTMVRQREKLEPVFRHFLVEDRGTDGSASYVDFLCHMHKEIRTMLS